MRHQPRQAVADVPFDVRVSDVQRRERPCGKRIPELVPVSGLHQLHLRLDLPRRLQRHRPQAQVPLLSLDRRTDDRPVLRNQHLLDDRLGTPADLDLLAHHLTIDPLTFIPVLRRVSRIDLLNEQVVAVNQCLRHPPGDLLVMPHHDAGGTRQAHAGRLDLRRVQVCLPPDRRHRQRQVRIARQQRLARNGLRTTHRPVVAHRLSDQACDSLALFEVLAEVRPAARRFRPRRHDHRPPGRVSRLELRHHRRAEPPDRPRSDDLAIPVTSQRPAEEPPERQRVRRLPRPRPISPDLELHRQPPVLDVRVDAGRIRLQDLSVVVAYRRPIRLRGAVETDPPDEAVYFDRRLANQLPQRPESRPAVELHLP